MEFMKCLLKEGREEGDVGAKGRGENPRQRKQQKESCGGTKIHMSSENRYFPGPGEVRLGRDLQECNFPL